MQSNFGQGGKVYECYATSKWSDDGVIPGEVHEATEITDLSAIYACDITSFRNGGNGGAKNSDYENIGGDSVAPLSTTFYKDNSIEFTKKSNSSELAGGGVWGGGASALGVGDAIGGSWRGYGGGGSGRTGSNEAGTCGGVG